MDPADTPSVPSPCVRLCTLDEHDTCVGCGRTLADITSWTRMSDDDKAACVARGRAALQQRGRELPPYPPGPLRPSGRRR